jgi:cathepsin F/cysteine peptidase B
MISVVALFAVLLAVNADFEKFIEFKYNFARIYQSADHEKRAYNAYLGNMQKAKQLNIEHPNATFSADTPFGDMTEAEFRVYHSGLVYPEGWTHEVDIKYPQAVAAKAAAGSVDWRTKGAVTAVKNQGECGSCWAFSATGSIEGSNFLKNGKLVSVSEEQLVDCDKTDMGCSGGLPSNAFDVLKRDRYGAETEESYPYTAFTGRQGKCKESNGKKAATVTGYDNMAHDESQMAAAMSSNGPISIGVNAMPWQMYSSGIMSARNCRASQPDHGVLAVAYGTTGNQDYWVVKNSWGASWGEKGYIRVERGGNACNIKFSPTQAIVA